MKKGHLPGRPVSLNDYSRGYIFNDIAFCSDYIGINPVKNANRSCAFVSSNKGLLFKIDCEKEILLCAYQLHNASITSFQIRNSCVVTGSADKKLKIWPLDFNDFLL